VTSRDDLLPLFNTLYDTHARALHAYLLGRTGDPARADDLLQETFVRAWQHLETVCEILPARRRYWLFHVARNALIDDARRRAARPYAPLAPEEIERHAGREAGVPSADAMIDLDAAIARLPETLRVVLAMSAVGGMTSAEIGEALGRPAGTVRYQLSQARKRLAAALRLDAQPPEPTRHPQEVNA